MANEMLECHSLVVSKMFTFFFFFQDISDIPEKKFDPPRMTRKKRAYIRWIFTIAFVLCKEKFEGKKPVLCCKLF